MHLALYQPDIPQNLGSILRLCACLDVRCHIIEPCGFPFDDKRIKRAGMDYMDQVRWQRHASWEAFSQHVQENALRRILLTTKTHTPYTALDYHPNDVVVMGRESAGVPTDVAQACEVKATIVMTPHTRSLNVAMASAIVLGEARRQLPLIRAGG